MDCGWHGANAEKDPRCSAYNAYDWNTELFPDPRAYVATVHTGNWSAAVGPAPHRPLKLILNTHNFLGVDVCQAEYADVAAAAGWDPTGGQPIPFNLSSPATMTAVFKHLLSRDAVGKATAGTRPDWWWTDGGLRKWTAATGLGVAADNLFTSTYLHSAALEFGADAAHNRPLVMPRYAGLGQHRHCCGFSGDAGSTWTTLQAEVDITKTAANVLFAYWSHDVGGFNGDPGPELYARWAQFGAMSPMWRSHGSNTNSPRRYWLFSSFPQIKEAMVLRARLAPVLYTLAASAFKTGLAAVRPVYFLADPTDPRSYADQYLYMVGDDVLVRPVVNPIAANATAGAVDVAVWLPSVRGSSAAGWVEWNSSVLHAGGTTVTVAATLSDLPLFVRAGAVLPLLPADCLDVTDPTATIWTLFPGAEAGGGSRYWDDGASTAYADTAASATQRLTYRWDDVPLGRRPRCAHVCCGRRQRDWGVQSSDGGDALALGRAARRSVYPGHYRDVQRCSRSHRGCSDALAAHPHWHGSRHVTHGGGALRQGHHRHHCVGGHTPRAPSRRVASGQAVPRSVQTPVLSSGQLSRKGDRSPSV
eukprot:m.264950 g.264950  ORF g.264950 m.264950 type:complete len:588 (-) comp26734_c0_seq2:1837-3600(-)